MDLLGLDREVGLAHASWVRCRKVLRTDPEGAVDPLARFRHVAGKTAFDEVRAYAAGAHEAPLREGILAWIHAFTQARVGFDAEATWAREATAMRGRVLLETPRATSYREAWQNVAVSRELATRIDWLDAAAELAPALAPWGRERSERRVEVGKRLGYEGHDEEIGDARLREAARQLLSRTSDLRVWLGREDARQAQTPQSRLAAWIGTAIATDAAEGWPARLTVRWLKEILPELSKGVEKRPELPRAAGAASFARALYAFGYAMREGGRNALPFSVAKAPDWVDPHRFGFIVGALPMQRVFQRTVLGLGERAANRQARSLARTSLFEAVWTSARWLASDPGAPRHQWEEVTHDVFGGPIDARFSGAWPERRDDDGPRLSALFSAEPLHAELVSRFDVDWFRNPRAGEWIRERAAGPARVPVEGEANPVLVASSLAKLFEEALG